MQENAVVEAAREFVRADASEAVAARHNDATAHRSAMERRAVALAKLKEAVAAYDAAVGRPAEGGKASGGSRRA